MIRVCALLTVLGLLLGGPVYAEREFGTPAFVVSCDVKSETITFKHTDDKKAWVESTATWDDKTEWRQADTEQTQYNPKPATAALAAGLKKDSKIYIMANDRGGTKLWIVSVKTLPPTFKVE